MLRKLRSLKVYPPCFRFVVVAGFACNRYFPVEDGGEAGPGMRLDNRFE